MPVGSRSLRSLALAAFAAGVAAWGSPPVAADETPSAAGSRIGAALQASDARDRERAFAALDALLADDSAAAANALSGLKDVLKRRGGAERARVARLLLKVPSSEATETWWTLFDPTKDDDTRVFEAAIEAVRDRAKDPALARRIVERARDPKASVEARAVAVEAVGLLDSPASRLVLSEPRPGAEGVEESCRALGLGHRGGDESIAPLIALLEHREVAPRVHAWESLVKITRQNLPIDPAAWSAWWEKRKAKGPAGPAVPAAAVGADPYAEPEPAHVPRYYDIPLKPKGGTSHVVFCLDVSASMSENGIEPARSHLRATIREMTTRHHFDVVAFNERVEPWGGRLVRAHPIPKARVIAWVEAIVPKSYTNLYDAIETAFQYMGRGRNPSEQPTRLDTVFLLSDGAPNRGRYHAQKQVVAGIAELSQKQVPVHTIGMGEDVFPLLKEIAQATGGSFLAPFE